MIDWNANYDCCPDLFSEDFDDGNAHLGEIEESDPVSKESTRVCLEFPETWMWYISQVLLIQLVH